MLFAGRHLAARMSLADAAIFLGCATRILGILHSNFLHTELVEVLLEAT